MATSTNDQQVIEELQNKSDSSFTSVERIQLRASITNILNDAKTFTEINDFYFNLAENECVSKRRLLRFFNPDIFQTNTKQRLLMEAQRNIYELLADIKSHPNDPKRYKRGSNSLEDNYFVCRLYDFYVLPRFFYYREEVEVERKIKLLAQTFSEEEVKQINSDMAKLINQANDITILRSLYDTHMDKPYITGHRNSALNLVSDYYYTNRRRRAIRLFRERALEIIHQQYSALSTLNFNQDASRGVIARNILENIKLLLTEDYFKSRHDCYDWLFNTTNTQPIDGLLAVRRAIITMPRPGVPLPLLAN